MLEYHSKKLNFENFDDLIIFVSTTMDGPRRAELEIKAIFKHDLIDDNLQQQLNQAVIIVQQKK